MALSKPKLEDIRKIHAEINQLVNQRFVLTTLAVTVFGLISTWGIPKEPLTSGTDLGWFRYMVAILTLVVLFGLYFLMHRLMGMLRILSTYLVATDSSNWEKDWALYRTRPYFAYTKAQAYTFVLLGILAAALPFLVSFAYHLTLKPCAGLAVTVGLAILYQIAIIGMAFYKWLDPESAALERWETLDEEKVSG
jgi:hypothetical protein